MKDDLAEEVVMCKNSNAVKCDWSTFESSSLVSALKGNGGVRTSCLKGNGGVRSSRVANHMRPKML